MPNLNALKRYCSKAIRRLMEINYYSARGFYKYMLNRAHQRYKGSPLLIYQMGKVGSKTVQASLRSLELDMPIYHTHILNKERISETELKRKKFFRTKRYSYLKRPWLNQFLLKKIESSSNTKK